MAYSLRSRLITFTVCYVAYGTMHAARDGFHATKPALMRELAVGEQLAGMADTMFMSLYAIGQFVCGAVSDRTDSRAVLAIGMLASGLLNLLISALGREAPAVFVLLRTLDGFLQAAGWSACVALVARVFGSGHRGLVFGLYSSCVNVGNIVGLNLVAVVFDALGNADAAWRNALRWLSSCQAVVAFIVLLLPCLVEKERPSGSTSSTGGTTTRPRSVGFLRAWMVPGVLPYAMSYFFIKATNYSLFFWLPHLLQEQHGSSNSDAARLAQFFDIGFLAGGILIGLASDLFTRCAGGVSEGRQPSRTPVILLFLLVALPGLVCLGQSTGVGMLIPGMLVVGICLGGPADAATGAVSADLGYASVLGDDTRAVATIAGIMDGTGAVGAAAAQVIVASVSAGSGWQATFYFFIGCTVFALVMILPQVWREARAHCGGGAGGFRRWPNEVSLNLPAQNLQAATARV